MGFSDEYRLLVEYLYILKIMEEKNLLRNYLHVILTVLGLNNIWFLFTFYCRVILDFYYIESICTLLFFFSVIFIHKLDITGKEYFMFFGSLDANFLICNTT